MKSSQRSAQQLQNNFGLQQIMARRDRNRRNRKKQSAAICIAKLFVVYSCVFNVYLYVVAATRDCRKTFTVRLAPHQHIYRRAEKNPTVDWCRKEKWFFNWVIS